MKGIMGLEVKKNILICKDKGGSNCLMALSSSYKLNFTYCIIVFALCCCIEVTQPLLTEQSMTHQSNILIGHNLHQVLLKLQCHCYLERNLLLFIQFLGINFSFDCYLGIAIYQKFQSHLQKIKFLNSV